MHTLNLRIPETHLDQVADAIAGLADPCPRHGDKCVKTLVALDACQLELLRLIELTGHGQITIEVAEGRPTDIHCHLNINGTQIRQDMRLGKDPHAKMAGLLRLADQASEEAA